MKKQEVVENLKVLHQGDAAEVVLLKRGLVGYYSDYEMAAEDILQYDGVCDIFTNLNHIDFDEAFLEENANTGLHPIVSEKYKKRNALPLPDKAAIDYYRYLLIDLDPKRKSTQQKISATDGEKDCALKTSQIIKRELAERGFPEPIYADSGNGFHLLYPMNLEANPRSEEAVKRVLWSIKAKFEDAGCLVDTTVFNCNRIIKLYGTKACKGIDSEDRPYRSSKILIVPEWVGGNQNDNSSN